MPVHVYGHSCDMDGAARFADKHGLLVIEDAAEAVARATTTGCAAASEHGLLSLFANKLITTIEAGWWSLVTTFRRAASLLQEFVFPARRLAALRSQGHLVSITACPTCSRRLASPARTRGFLGRRRANAARYDALLVGQRGITTPPAAPWTLNSYWMYGILIGDDFGPSRDADGEN